MSTSTHNSITSKPRRFSIGKRRTYAGWSFRYPSGQIFKTLARGFDQYPPHSVHAVIEVEGGHQIELPLHSEADGWAHYNPPVKNEAEAQPVQPAQVEVEPAPQGCVGQPCGGSQIGG